MSSMLDQSIRSRVIDNVVTNPYVPNLKRARVVAIDNTPGDAEGDMVGASAISAYFGTGVNSPAFRMANYAGSGSGPLVLETINEASALDSHVHNRGTSSWSLFQSLTDRTDWGFKCGAAGYYQGTIYFHAALTGSGAPKGELRIAFNNSTASDSRCHRSRSVNLGAIYGIRVDFAGDMMANDLLTPMIQTLSTEQDFTGSTVGVISFQAFQLA